MMSTRTSTTTLRVTRSTVFLLTRVIRGFIWISKVKASGPTLCINKKWNECLLMALLGEGGGDTGI
jgi:hypothetical protein